MQGAGKAEFCSVSDIIFLPISKTLVDNLTTPYSGADFSNFCALQVVLLTNIRIGDPYTV
jgi:hypothetical protein